MKAQKLLSIGNDSKTVKDESRGYLTAILYLAPGSLSGRNVCAFATEGCLEACLNTAGRGITSSVQQARIKRTLFFFKDREAFIQQLVEELTSFQETCRKAGMIPVCRLNGTSDILWETIKVYRREIDQGLPLPNYANIMARFPDVHFYDYTKNPQRAAASLREGWPTNYRFVLSRSESNLDACLAHLRSGGNVAMVFATKPKQPLYPYWVGPLDPVESRMRVPIIDGDKDDLRFLDPSPCIVGLRAKGKARQDTSGFVIR